ncbi:RsfA family transcriptional regulator [Geomicrobium sp. JCM 19039]|uniref:RsfA family transcriptional regulator n=1 Tax=Geomicrobium sp. JCM 19039 TaxID=1460636 RepID=UPI0005A64D17|nr:RsfA family transcriptional regulator [Geomicrobium sp. JCM 19039]
MTKVRQDAWSHEDDVLLADTVIHHIKNGSTQLKAFEEVGDQLNRTAAACGFRWNAVVRDRYETKISEAKRERKAFQRNDAAQAVQKTFGVKHPQRSIEKPVHTDDLNMERVVQFLSHYVHQETIDADTKTNVEQVQLENEQLKSRLEKLEKEHESLLTIINRARNMMFVDETMSDSFMSSSFRMDENGNLQHVSKAD